MKHKIRVEDLCDVLINRDPERLKDVDLIDFLPSIGGNCREDLAIMKHWVEHFDSLDVPYIITERLGNYTLWKKEEKIEEMQKHECKQSNLGRTAGEGS
jgi:hypothetical protein